MNVPHQDVYINLIFLETKDYRLIGNLGVGHAFAGLLYLQPN